MNKQHWDRLQVLLQAAWALAPAERAAYLEKQCDDPDLRQRAQALLAADEEAEGYFDRLASDVGVTHEEDRMPVDLSGRRVGRYRLLEPLGRGGMGVVYLAERADGAFDQQVAVKLLAMALAGPEGNRRFVAERQILAGLEHPAIARLLDGGVTEDGTPYFVMERVPGERIDAWCDRRRSGIRERIELLRRVCGAVAYAHRNLIVHRDLKPANVLITDQGDPKLLDFGVAKLLTGVDSGLTRSRGAAPLTPASAAPEQIEGGTVTTATDTYALGALAHVLLAGVSPHDPEDRSPTAILRQLQTEPVAPSRKLASLPQAEQARIAAARGTTVAELRRSLTGDLDAILLRALAPKPERRYGSAAELAADLEAHLEGRPVTARPPSVGYRLGRFVDRHRVGVAAAAAIALLLLCLVVVSVGSAVSSRRQAERVGAERDRAQQVTVFLKDLFRANDPDVAQGREITARDLLDQGAREVGRSFGDSPGLRAEMLVLLGDLYRQIGEYEPARPLLDEGRELADVSGDLEVRVDALHALGHLDREVGRHDEALAALERAEELLEEAGLVPSEKHGNMMSALLDTLASRGRLTEAADRGEAALVAARADPYLPADALFYYLSNAGYTRLRTDEVGRAEALYREAMALDSDAGDEPTTRIALHSILASVLQRSGDLEEALVHRRQVLTLADEIYPPSHVERARLRNNLGSVLLDLGRIDEAEATLRQALEIYERAYGERGHFRVAACHNNLGLALVYGERYAEAEPQLARARELTGEHYGSQHPVYATITANLGDVLGRLGRHGEAEALLLDALEIRRRNLGPDDGYVGESLSSLAELRLAEGRPAEALELAEEAVALFRRIGYEKPGRTLLVLGARAQALDRLGRIEEARTSFTESIAFGETVSANAGPAWPRLLAAYAEFQAERNEPGATDTVERALEENRRIFGDAHPATQRLETLALAD